MTTSATWEYAGTVVRVVDGDTVVLRLTKTFTQEIDFGFFVKDSMSLTKSAEIDFRLMNINAPEKVGPNKARGEASKRALESLLAQGSIRVVSYKPDKYGRWLADLYVTPAGAPEFHVNAKLIELGHAVPWDGRGERPS
jgi:endonuclease YncB( thermonuclease family)